MPHRLAPLALLLLVWSGGVQAAPPADLEAEIETILARAGQPGMSVAIVEAGKITFAKGFGTRAVGRNAPVDADTMFEIGSISKHFTATALGLLVEEGRIGWDDKVIDHLPEFRMADPWVTREFTVRDLLTHRSGLGLGSGDLMFAPRTDHSRAEIVKGLRYMKPETSFRSAFAYNNLMYVTAGELIERVSGESWEDFVRARLLRPAGMAKSTTEEAARYLNPNRAQPHARLGPPARGFGDVTMLNEKAGLGPNAAPAGGIASNANEMARWIMVQLARGKLPEGDARLWSETTSREMWTGVTPVPIPPASNPNMPSPPKFSTYGLGWFIRDHNGLRVVEHAGGTLGFIAQLVLFPERDVGFIILQNGEEAHALRAVQHMLMDHYAGLPRTDWGARMADAVAARNVKVKELLAKAEAPGTSIPPSLPLPAYAGTFADPWYGRMTVTPEGGALVLDMTRTPGMSATLAPYRGDTFVARWRDGTIEPAYVTFATSVDGKATGATMKAVSPIADFSFDFHDLAFTRVPEKVGK